MLKLLSFLTIFVDVLRTLLKVPPQKIIVTPRFPKQHDFIITIRVNSQTEHYTAYSQKFFNRK